MSSIINFKNIFSNLENEFYVIIKLNPSFPIFTKGSDIDIFCFNIDKVVSVILFNLNELTDSYKIQLTKKNETHFYIDILEKNGDIYFRFDLYSALPKYYNLNIKESFFYACVYESQKKKIDDYFIKVVSDENEAILRYIEYHEWYSSRPDKIKHIDYILENRLNNKSFFDRLHYFIAFNETLECEKKSFFKNWFEFFEGYLNKIKIVYNYIKTRGLKPTLIKIKEKL